MPTHQCQQFPQSLPFQWVGREENIGSRANEGKERFGNKGQDDLIEHLSRMKASLPLIINKTNASPILSSNAQKAKDHYCI